MATSQKTRWLLRSILRAVSYFSLQTVTTRETQARQRRAINEGVFSRLVPIPSNITSWFTIALAEIRTRWILREKAECKQSSCGEVRMFPTMHAGGRAMLYMSLMLSPPAIPTFFWEGPREGPRNRFLPRLLCVETKNQTWRTKT